MREHAMNINGTGERNAAWMAQGNHSALISHDLQRINIPCVKHGDDGKARSAATAKADTPPNRQPLFLHGWHKNAPPFAEDGRPDPAPGAGAGWGWARVRAGVRVQGLAAKVPS